jgi:hypothetical protein
LIVSTNDSSNHNEFDLIGKHTKDTRAVLYPVFYFATSTMPITRTTTKQFISMGANPETARNQKIIALGKKHKWGDIIFLYQQDSEYFNGIHYSTAMNQFDRIASVDTTDPRFCRFVDDLARKIFDRGFEWMDIRGISTIAHAIGTLQLKTQSAKNIMAFICERKNTHTIVSNGPPQSIAFICWSMAKLEKPR